MDRNRWNRLEEIFTQALEMPEPDRSAFLDRACDGDPAMRCEVASLIVRAQGDGESLQEVVTAAVKTANAGNGMIGRRLAHYEIKSHLGSGGMGDVYRARDTQLQRDVALKLLPEIFASDAERLARFQREAQVLAALNHPNIAQIYGLEGTGTSRCIVMELVEGDTLQDRLKRGPIPVKEALAIAEQMTEALEAAHEKDIIHRDLKPANAKITPEGRVKVLDFGLAKPLEEPHPDLSNSPTSRMAATDARVILGTAAYMSPEQARGEKVDERTDIWSFGCVLYELLTGKQAFGGETVTDTLAAVLKTEPDWNRLAAATPASIRVLLRRCLQKDLKRRLRDASDARIEIQDALEAPAAAEATAVGPGTRRTRNAWRWALVLGLVSLAVDALTGIAVWNLRAPPAVSRVTIMLPAGQRLAALDQPAIALSPDGKNLVYVAAQDLGAGTGVSPASQGQAGRPVATGTQQLFLRPLDSQEAKPIAGTKGAVSPFFSPDSQWIGFFAGGKLKKVSVNGGAPVTLANAPIPGGASWSSQGTLVLQGVVGQGLQQVSQEGGTPQPLTRLGKGEIIHRWPEVLSGGKAVLFAGSPNFNPRRNMQIAVQPIGAGDRKDLVQDATQPRYAATGHLLWVQDGTLMAAPFDAKRLTLTRAAVPAIEGVVQSGTGAAQYSISSTGTLVYLAGGPAGRQSRLVWVSRNGEEQPLPAAPRSYQFPRLSPDGGRVAVGAGAPEPQIWVYDVSRDTFTRLTFEGNVNNIPAWSPDGLQVAFRSNRTGGPGSLFWQASDGSGAAERLTTSESPHAPNSFSPDGQLLAFDEQRAETGRDIWVLNLKERKAQPFLRTPYEETAPKFSPDGKWLAYSSDESGRREIYVQPYPGPGGKWQISAGGGQEPVWNPNGLELFTAAGGSGWRWTWTRNLASRPANPRCSLKDRTYPRSTTFPTTMSRATASGF